MRREEREEREADREAEREKENKEKNSPSLYRLASYWFTPSVIHIF